MKAEMANVRVNDFGSAAAMSAGPRILVVSNRSRPEPKEVQGILLDAPSRSIGSYRPEWRIKHEGERQPIDKVKRKRKNKEQRKAPRR